MRRLVLAVVILTVAMAGCLGSSSFIPNQLKDANANHAGSTHTTVVVALADSGIQPYHEVFEAPQGWIAPSIPGTITLGDEFRNRVLQHLEVWNELKPDQLYYFQGTRVFAISKFEESNDILVRSNPHIIYDDEVGDLGHGTGTASLVAQASPNATVLMIEVSGSVNKTWDWIAQQPWIDIASEQQGQPANLPETDSGPDFKAAGMLNIVNSGKLLVNSAGNSATPAAFDRTSAPWVIVVGGAEIRTRGESVLASKMVDVVANFSSDRVANKSDLHGYIRNGGTSFSAPVVSGTLGEALYELREKYGDPGLHLSPAPLVNTTAKVIRHLDLRAALNATAFYWNTTDYDPLGYPYQSANDAVGTTIPVLPAATSAPTGPWVQMGWGFVDESLIPQLVGTLSGETPLPVKAPEAVDYMHQVWDAKAAYWRLRQG